MRYKIFFLVLVLPVLLIGQNKIELYGVAEQGGLLIGKISPKIENVFFDYKKIEIHNNTFLLGFDREAKLHHILSIVFDNGSMRSFRFEIKKKDYDIQEIKMPKSKAKYFKPKPAETISRINQEAENLRKARKLIEGNSSFDFCFSSPIENAPISSKFGAQRIINGKAKKPHLGLDFAAPKGTAVKAMNSGKVILTGDYYYNGKFDVYQRTYVVTPKDRYLNLKYLYYRKNQVYNHHDLLFAEHYKKNYQKIKIKSL